MTKEKRFTVATSSIIVFISTLFILLFGYTAFNKLFALSKFSAAMRKSDLLRPYANILAYTIPLAEIIICLLLVIPVLKIGKQILPTRTIGLYGSAFLMFLFTGYVAFMLFIIREHLPCTCGGFISAMSWHQHLIFNSIFLLIALFALFIVHKNKNSITLFSYFFLQKKQGNPKT